MARAALVTGASSGIGLAIAKVLGEEGYALTIVSRRADRLERAAEQLRLDGVEFAAVPCDVTSEDEIVDAVRAHEDRFGRLDVLVNNAGLGIGGPLEGFETKHMDVQWSANVRGPMVFTREAMGMLREAGEEHQNALVVNTSSIAGKVGARWLSVYSATKHGLVGFTEALNEDLKGAGIKACVLCPGYVDTALSDYIKDRVPAEEMIRAQDLAEGVRYLLKLSAHCLVPELIFKRPVDDPV